MSKIKKFLKTYFLYILNPISTRDQFDWNCEPFYIRARHCITFGLSFFVAYLIYPLSIPKCICIAIALYLISSLVLFFVLRHEFYPNQDSNSPLTYERFLIQYSCFPDRLYCSNYIKNKELRLVVDKEDGEYRAWHNHETAYYYRCIKPQTITDAILIYYYLLPDYIKAKKEKVEQKAREAKEREQKELIEKYTIYKKYFEGDVKEMCAEIDKNIAAYQASVENFQNREEKVS